MRSFLIVSLLVAVLFSSSVEFVNSVETYSLTFLSDWPMGEISTDSEPIEGPFGIEYYLGGTTVTITILSDDYSNESYTRYIYSHAVGEGEEGFWKKQGFVFLSRPDGTGLRLMSKKL